MVHDLEPLLAFWEVHTTDIHDTLELALGVVTEEGENGNNGGGSDVERQFVLEYGELLDELGEALGKVGAVGVQCLGGRGVFGSSRIG